MLQPRPERCHVPGFITPALVHRRWYKNISQVHGLTLPVPFVCRTGAGEQEVDSCRGRYGGNCNVDFFLFFFFFFLVMGGYINK